MNDRTLCVCVWCNNQRGIWMSSSWSHATMFNSTGKSKWQRLLSNEMMINLKLKFEDFFRDARLGNGMVGLSDSNFESVFEHSKTFLIWTLWTMILNLESLLKKLRSFKLIERFAILKIIDLEIISFCENDTVVWKYIKIRKVFLITYWW